MIRPVSALQGAPHPEGVTIPLVEPNARGGLRVAGRGYVMETGKIVLAWAAGSLREDQLVSATYPRLAREFRP